MMTICNKFLFLLFPLLALQIFVFLFWGAQGLLWSTFVLLNSHLFLAIFVYKDISLFFEANLFKGKDYWNFLNRAEQLCKNRPNGLPQFWITEHQTSFLAFYGFRKLNIVVSRNWLDSFSEEEQMALLEYAISCFDTSNFPLLQNLLMFYMYVSFSLVTVITSFFNLLTGVFVSPLNAPHRRNWLLISMSIFWSRVFKLLGLKKFFKENRKGINSKILKQALWKQETFFQTLPLNSPPFLLMNYITHPLTRNCYHKYIKLHPRVTS